VELAQVAGHMWRFWEPGYMPRMRRLYIVPGLVLFYLRCRYFPTWGAYIWYHGWGEFGHAYRHPAVYLDLQNEVGYRAFLQACANIMRYVANWAVGTFAMALTLNGDMMGNVIGQTAAVYSVFHCLCTIDRSLFAITAVVATLVACARVMFHDFESIASVFKFSLFFWFLIFMQLVATGLQIGATELGGGLYAVIGGAIAQVVILFVCARYAYEIISFLYGMAKPARMLAMWTFRVVLNGSIYLAELAGIALVLYLAWRAVYAMHKFLWDPYDLESGLKDLVRASDRVRKTLGTAGPNSTRTNRIGWYPLGERVPKDHEQALLDEVNKERGPPRAPVPLQESLLEMHGAVAESVGAVAGGVVQYFEGAEWERDREGLGEILDKVVLTTGDSVVMAIDGIGEQVGKVVGSLGVGAALGDGPRQVQLLVRDALEGNQKEE
jgi:hypothetical protein